MKELAIRAASGAVYVALTLGAAWSGPLTTFLLFLPVCGVAAAELGRLLFQEEEPFLTWWNVLLAVTVYTAIGMGHFMPDLSLAVITAVPFVMILLGSAAILVKRIPDPGGAVGSMFMQVFLVALPFGAIPHLFDQGPWLFIGFMLMLWTNDTGAYLVGRTIGRTKLLPHVSPKKTVEGFLGGAALTILVGYFLGLQLDILSDTDWMLCAGIVALTATLGDLLESGLKRARGVKDSGKVLPGHGGILDRFDGFLLAIPAMILYLHLKA